MPSTSTWRSREKVKVFAGAAGPVPEKMGIMGIMGVMSVGGANRAGIAEQAARDVSEELGEQGGFLEIVGTAGRDEAGPVLECGLPGASLLRQIE